MNQNQQTHTDADIFRFMLNARKRGGANYEQKCSGRGQSLIKKLERYYGGAVLQMFEALTPFPLDWEYFTFSRLSLIMEVNCEEEVYAYLKALHNLWIYVLGSELYIQDLDEETVQSLHLKMPAHSDIDANEIRRRMHVKDLFYSVQDPSARQAVTERLVKCQRFITLETFFKDVIYLKACSDGLYQLFPRNGIRTKRPSNSLRATLKQCFTGDVEQFYVAYLDTCFYAMRNFAYIADKKFNKPLVDSGSKATASQTTYNSDPGRLARHVLSRGFRSSHIHKVAARTVTPDEFDRVSLEIPWLSTDDQYLPENERCNRPYEQSYSRNRGFTTMENVVATFPKKSGAYASPFAVTRHIALCFWGDILPTSAELQQQRENASNRSYIQEVRSPGQSQVVICRPNSSRYKGWACSPSPSSEPMDGQEFSTNMGILVATNRNVRTVSPLDYTSIETRRQGLRISEASSVSTELCESAYEVEMPADRREAYPLDRDNDAAVNRQADNSQDRLHQLAKTLHDEAHLTKVYSLAREKTPTKRERLFGIRRESNHAKQRRQRKTHGTRMTSSPRLDASRSCSQVDLLVTGSPNLDPGSTCTDSMWGVDRIIDSFHNNEGTMVYRVRWDDTWEPAENLQGYADHAIAEFHGANPRRPATP